jgi:excisionase family DNA binding protein
MKRTMIILTMLRAFWRSLVRLIRDKHGEMSVPRVVTEIFKDFPDVVTPANLQKMLAIGRNTVYELLRAGIIPSVKIGKQIRISKQAVIDYLHNQNKAKGI